MPDPPPENVFAKARCVVARFLTRRIAERDCALSDRGTGRKGSNDLARGLPYHDHRHAVNEHHELIRY
jgi:hypothetical protein